MTTLREAAQAALALVNDTLLERTVDTKRLSAVGRDLEAALDAEPAQPVVWMVYTEDGKSVYVTDNPNDISEKERALPLFTRPYTRVCTCHPDDSPPIPCARKYALDECRSTADAIREAVEAEREACAKLAENTVCDVHLPTGIRIYGYVAARAIRARGAA